MRDCDAFLQWALPELHLRWRGFRRVRGQVCKRIEHRRAELELADLAGYRAYLAAHPDEWRVLDELCFVTISRFARDRAVWMTLVDDVLPRLARDATCVRAWSAACGAGEEPFTLAIAWQLAIVPRFPRATLELLATDAHAYQLERAAEASYPPGTLRELPDAWRVAFDAIGDRQRVRDAFRTVRFARHDLRDETPGTFDLILCRNMAFTYFDDALQLRTAERLRDSLRPGGVLVIGMHEDVPEVGLARIARCVYGRNYGETG